MKKQKRFFFLVKKEKPVSPVPILNNMAQKNFLEQFLPLLLMREMRKWTCFLLRGIQ